MSEDWDPMQRDPPRPPLGQGGRIWPAPDELGSRFGREIGRFRAREAGHRSFWRSLGVLGGIGWPIALLAVGGGLLGRWLDGRWQTGTRLTMLLLCLGAAAGGAVAWSVVEGTRRQR